MNTLLLAISSGAAAGLTIGMVILFAVVAIIVIVAKLIVVGNPNEMVIITGGQTREGLGYRTIIGGRKLVIPVINKVSRLSLRNMQVAL